MSFEFFMAVGIYAVGTTLWLLKLQRTIDRADQRFHCKSWRCDVCREALRVELEEVRP